MATYTVDAYLYYVSEPHGESFKLKISDDDDRLNWTGEESASIDGNNFSIQESGIYKITFETSGGDSVTEDVVYSYVASVGWVMIPAVSDTQFDAGSKITHHLGWQEYGVDYDQFVCFANHTLIDTPNGPRPIEEISEGDFVLTLDNGAQPVIWAGSSRVPMATQITAPTKRAITIRKNAFGQNRPSRDILVSPQHRVLIGDWRAKLLFGEDQILAPAIGLLDGENIHRAPPVPNLSWHHILLRRHEILTSSNLLTESFFPGKNGLKSLNTNARAALKRKLTKLSLATDNYGQTARLCLTTKEARSLRLFGSNGRKTYGPAQKALADPARTPDFGVAGR